MDNIVQTIIDALSQEYGRRHTPGWLYVLGVLSSVVGTISAKQLADKRRVLRMAKAEELNTQILRASLISQEENGEIEYIGTLRKEENGYRLIIEAREDGMNRVTTDVVKRSLDQVAEYLRAETKFILADFK